jgi:hypothetical protein
MNAGTRLITLGTSAGPPPNRCALLYWNRDKHARLVTYRAREMSLPGQSSAR